VLPGIFFDRWGVWLFNFISFRAAMAALTAFALALWWGKLTIAWLRRHRVSERQTKVGHAELEAMATEMGKDKTTTMGGSFLVVALLVSVVLWARLNNLYVVLGVLLTSGMAAVGFVDDFKKLTEPFSKGLSPSAKMLGLTLVALAAVGALAFYAVQTGRHALLALHPPFFKDTAIPLGTWGMLGVLGFIGFGWLVVVGTANAANITDGLDGLAAGCMVISGLTLSVFCYVTGRPDWTSYLNLPFVRAASEMAVVGGALVGACMGFLWYNAFPAKVFMGDSGSLPLGGLLAWMAVVSKQELVLPLIASVFFLELLSSFLQRTYYRRTGGRRLFTCAPIHHGLQLYGGVFQRGEQRWHEVTIVIRLWILAAVCAMSSMAFLKVR
jgi:phospho-N-acetylmuramoyl-pentapeptide-transferase